MITITRTISLCLSNRTVPCIYLGSHVRLSAESYLNRRLNTQCIEYSVYFFLYTLGWIHTSSLTDILHGLLAAAETLCSKLAKFSQDLLSARRLRHRLRYVERIFSVLLTSRHRNRTNKTLEMRMCRKPNSKMLRDSGFVYRVYTGQSYYTHVSVVKVCGTVCEPVSLVESHIKQKPNNFRFNVHCTKRHTNENDCIWQNYNKINIKLINCGTYKNWNTYTGEN